LAERFILDLFAKDLKKGLCITQLASKASCQQDLYKNKFLNKNYKITQIFILVIT